MNSINDIQNRLRLKKTSCLTYFKIWLLLSFVTLLSFVFQYSTSASVDYFMLGDPGGALKADYLIAQGYLPTIDFKYYYGLLPLSVGHFWFEIFGRNPQAYLAAMLVFNLLIATALTRIVVLVDLRRIGIIFIACTIPFSIMPIYPNFTHAFEALMICIALGEHIYGRRYYALIALTFNLFAKPSLSYVYILLILILYIIDLLRKKTQPVTVFLQILPASLTFIFLCVLMGISFGIMPLLNSLIPIGASESYKASNFGFFTGIGRDFWYPPQAKISDYIVYYLGTITGFWIFTTVILFLSLIYFFWQIINKKLYSLELPLLEVYLCISSLHVSFILFFFAGNWSWSYYSYLLPIGVSFLTSYKFYDFKKTRFFLFCIIISLILVGYRAMITNSYRGWHYTKYQNSIIGLYASDDYKNEFINLVESCKMQKSLILFNRGATDLFFPQCSMPSTWFLVPPFNNFLENSRIEQQVSQAKLIITRRVQLDQIDILKIKAMKVYSEKFQLYQTTKNFFYYRKMFKQ